jgi:hypothetical protein
LPHNHLDSPPAAGLCSDAEITGPTGLSADLFWSTAMTNQHHERAEAVVSAFKEILGAQICRQISEAQFSDLDRLIRELVSAELRDAAERMETLARELRKETDFPELGL